MKLIDQSAVSLETFSFKLQTSPAPFSLTPFLYKGGAAMNRRQVKTLESNCILIESRIPLIRTIYDELLTKRVAGFPDKTISNFYYGLKDFFRWADDNDHSPSLPTLVDDYLEYTEHLLFRNRTLENLKETSVYAMAATVSSVFDGVLDLKYGLLYQSRIRKPITPPPWKESQEFAIDTEAQEMGNALLNISNALSLESICEGLPKRIALQGDKQISLGLNGFRDAVPPLDDGTPDIARVIQRRRVLINFRTEVELLIFISQTGMNLEQVRTQKLAQFRYVRDKDSANSINIVKNYKARRGGEVEFEIFPEYKKMFRRYIAFRLQVFPDDPNGLLFKFLDTPGSKKQRYYDPTSVRDKFQEAGIPYRSPTKLRSIRLSSLLEKTGDIIAVSEMGQHSPEVLTQHYAAPNVNRAFREVALFHQLNDPTIESPGPGICVAQTPQEIGDVPITAPTPDCRSPSGCLFCDKQRDVDSLEHIWSLLSFRHLKSIELSKYRGKETSGQPAYAVIQRISEKVRFIASSNSKRSEWTTEAKKRIQENWFHPAWQCFIEFAETIV
jgi:hypothetical protein